MKLTNQEREWVHKKWAIIRRCQKNADQASNAWNRINDEINNRLIREGVMDLVQREEIKSKSLPLKSEFDKGKWNAAEAQRHIDDVQLFLKLRELEII